MGMNSASQYPLRSMDQKKTALAVLPLPSAKGWSYCRAVGLRSERNSESGSAATLDDHDIEDFIA